MSYLFYLFLPTFHLRGRRWRVRLCPAGRWRLLRQSERFPQGTVHRVWLGPVLVVALVDRGSAV